MGKKLIVSITLENKRISIKNSLPYFKCVLRLSCVVHGPIYGRFRDVTHNNFVSAWATCGKMRLGYVTESHRYQTKEPLSE